MSADGPIEFDARIDSAQNETFRRVARLVASSRERRSEQRSVLEGIHLVESFWETGLKGQVDGPNMHYLFVPDSHVDHPETAALVARIRASCAEAEQTGLSSGQPLRIISLATSLFRKISQVEHGGGPIAVIDTPRPPLPAQLQGDSLYLDRVQDPGNMGSIVRTSAAAGLANVLCSPGTAFGWAPKVLRAAMGAHFALGLHEGVRAEQLTDRWINGLQIRALVAPGQCANAQTLFEADLRAPTLWLAGNEGQGLDDIFLQDPRSRPVTIEQNNAVESMNIAAAVAVALFEQRRQRNE